MKIFVIGPGRWGSFIAWYLDSVGHSVTLYGRDSSEKMKELIATRKNSLLALPSSVALTTRLDGAMETDIIVISVASQALRFVMSELSSLRIKSKKFVLCMKGIEISSGKRLSEVCEEYLDTGSSVAVWLGPGHVEEFYLGRPNCMVIDSKSEQLKAELISAFQSPLIRFYYGTDLVGSEIGAAAKNVIGIAAGVLDGLGLTSLKGALMARAPREISRLIEALSGSPISAYGLCHLGDYEATLFSPHSHNRAYGEMLVSGKAPDFLAEGYYTVKALINLSDSLGVDLPICRAVYNVIYSGSDVKTEICALFDRSLKSEF